MLINVGKCHRICANLQKEICANIEISNGYTYLPDCDCRAAPYNSHDTYTDTDVSIASVLWLHNNDTECKHVQQHQHQYVLLLAHSLEPLLYRLVLSAIFAYCRKPFTLCTRVYARANMYCHCVVYICMRVYAN